ncbi:hypothetical protein [Aeromonas veronii]|uniref:hypothetical protein n=1 Tax=Aeromonas veronii TaxID=654 RepID=UPI000EB1DDED|nr:hypothetical protein [Aeromonas veronii]AYK20508.1 hypothetical protein C0073_022660 [Aeromonas veronii]
MMDADDILNIVTFLGDEMTDEQAQRLMDQAKSCCSIADMERIKDAVGGLLHPALRVRGRNGWFSQVLKGRNHEA